MSPTGRAGAEHARHRLIEMLARRGIRDRAVLRAMDEVPREAFLPPELAEFAYEDTPLPIEEGQTISQPYIVALMALAADLQPTDRVLEVGTGSGYAAAVLSRLAGQVYTIERHGALAQLARRRLAELGIANVHVRHGDGTRGWPEQAPFDAILVTAAGPEVPQALRDQLGNHGRLVIPVGDVPRTQRLVRWIRTDGGIREEDLGAVRFVPLIGEEGWAPPPGTPIVTGTPIREAPVASPTAAVTPRPSDVGAVAALREAAVPVIDPDTADLGSLVERIANARVVLIGESTHGTSEFYRMRAHLTRVLIEEHGFRIVGIEGDWPDVARVHRWVRHEADRNGWAPFARFPRWMWRNRETESFVSWLRAWNEEQAPEDRGGIYGLDLYSLHRSMEAVLGYLERVDPDAAAVARERYGCLTPWQHDPATYGRAVLTRRHRLCEDEVVAMLRELLASRVDYMAQDGDRFLDAVHNARLVADAEAYYRVMYEGGHASWNLRDRHMFETLVALLDWYGKDARAVVWAHNSHVGDASATEMGGQGQTNVGELARGHFAERAFLIGQGTDRGSVAAAHDWGGPMEIRLLRPSWPGSYEAICHATDVTGFLVHLREPEQDRLLDELLPPRLERAVGVVYRPESELQSHYFQASLPRQMDAWIWFDETRAVTPLTHPSGDARGAFFAEGGIE